MSTESPHASRRVLSVAFLAGLLTIVAGGAVHGMLTQRWGANDDLELAARTLTEFPDSFGPWRLQDSSTMAENVEETLRCAGYVNRSYLNIETSEEVTMALFAGPPGPTAVHTPEICYSSQAYDIEQQPTAVSLAVDDRKHSFWFMRFKSKRAGGAKLHVYYAWTCSEIWNASEAPRFEYGGRAYLHKLQVAGSPMLSGKEKQGDLCRRFLMDLLRSEWKPYTNAE